MSAIGPMLIIGAGVSVALLWVVVQDLVSAEVSGWLPHASRGFLKAAARKLPPEHQDRYSAEWLAELDAFSDRKLTGLIYAIGVWRNAPGTALELGTMAKESGSILNVRVPTQVDIDAAAAYIASLLERTDPGQSNWEKALEEMRAAQRELEDVDSELSRLSKDYADLVSTRRLPFVWRQTKHGGITSD